MVTRMRIRSFESLPFLPRYSKGKIRINGLMIYYNDPLALFNEYNDIFHKRIYDFSPVRSDPVIIDAGGYIGLSAMNYKITIPDSEIIVFEPDPQVFGLLQKNILSNNLSGIEMINSGVGVKNGRARFYPDGADGGNMMNGKKDSEIEVKTLKLSSVITRNIDMLKMNIEGMEGDVIQEIEEKLYLIREIIFEYHYGDKFPQNLGKILNIFDRNGFRYMVSNVPCAPIKLPFNMSKNKKNFNLVYARNSGSKHY